MKNIYLLTGSNVEPRLSFLEKAAVEIENRIGAVIKKSGIYESAPWGFKDETYFLNQVLVVDSEMTAYKVLKTVLNIENEMGRVRDGRSYSSRKIDIDILYFGESIFEEDELQVPHPRLHLRRFTLLPLNDLAPEYIHPKLGLSNMELLDKCEDQSIVKKLNF